MNHISIFMIFLFQESYFKFFRIFVQESYFKFYEPVKNTIFTGGIAFKCLKTRGNKERYQIKYCDVMTLLNVTNRNVWRKEAKYISSQYRNDIETHNPI